MLRITPGFEFASLPCIPQRYRYIQKMVRELIGAGKKQNCHKQLSRSIIKQFCPARGNATGETLIAVVFNIQDFRQFI
jgi:hypothetical protein